MKKVAGNGRKQKKPEKKELWKQIGMGTLTSLLASLVREFIQMLFR